MGGAKLICWERKIEGENVWVSQRIFTFCALGKRSENTSTHNVTRPCVCVLLRWLNYMKCIEENLQRKRTLFSVYKNNVENNKKNFLNIIIY